MREDRIAFVGHDGHLRPALRRGANVTAQGGQLISANASQQLAAGHHLGLERFLEDRRLEDDHRLFQENLGQLARVLDVVEPTRPWSAMRIMVSGPAWPEMSTVLT